ncbi:MAG: 2-C-methyl-D-erythritol 4-phosphate cytidylyltransferase [Candidatus Latescibacterota bacterium]|nr:MAG: 2-C-methyl-D-erythritol 4-phosphate cytidylyltransferase [Candidatus Latescibacterota bacterium]
MKVSVIVPAAGKSKRFGGEEKKIFAKIAGQCVFLRTLELFINREDVCQVILVVGKDDIDTIKTNYGDTLNKMNVEMVIGGATRTESVRNALVKVNDQADFVCVHDAVRPCVSQLWIDKVFEAADKYGSAILAHPIHETVKKVGKDNEIIQTVRRDDLWQAQTPQVFRKEILMRAYQNASGSADDDAALVEAIGEKVIIVPGDPRNIKITTREDLELAKAVIDTLPKPGIENSTSPIEEISDKIEDKFH